MKYEKCPVCGENIPELKNEYDYLYCNCGVYFDKFNGKIRCFILHTKFTEKNPPLLHIFARKAFLAAREMQTHNLKYKYDGYDEWVKTL